MPPSVETCARPPGPGIARTYTSGRPDSFDTYASHFPSGETLGIISSALVAMKGCSAAGVSTGAIQMSRVGAPTRTARYPLPLFGKESSSVPWCGTDTKVFAAPPASHGCPTMCSNPESRET